ASGTRSRFTAGTRDKFWSTWSPDGKLLAFATDHPGSSGYDIVVRPTDGNAERILVSDAVDNEVPTGFSPDGRFLLFSKRRQLRDDLLMIAVDGTGAPRPIAATPTAVETLAQVSPNGRY